MTSKQKQILIGFVTNPKSLVIFIFSRFITRFISNDETYLKILFRLTMGRKLNLKNPQTFQEKLQWLKLNNRKPEYTKMVDKYEAKKYVASVLGVEYIIPTLGVWDAFDEIDFTKLPNKFVLKCTHDSGRVVICKDKTSFDITQARKRINKALHTNFYLRGREWPYKDVKPRIIAEQFMENYSRPSATLADYKFYCFDGEPRYCQVIQDRDTKETIDFFDMDWNHQEFVGLNPAAGPAALCPVKPDSFSEMKRIAKDLSKDIPFSRIDLYEINTHVYFGEVTLYPASGFGVFTPGKYEETLGKMIRLKGLGGGKFVITISSKGMTLDAVDDDLKDYKFFCFDGKVKFFKVDYDRFTDHHANYYSRESKLLRFGEIVCPPNFDKIIELPNNLNDMIVLAEKLSAGMPFLRVDFYSVNDKIYFGEMTFFPDSGLGKFEPKEWDYKTGEMIKVPF